MQPEPGISRPSVGRAVKQLPPTPKDTATAALGVDVGLWIDRHRTSPPRLSYRQIAAVLADETGVIVTREALRQWHVAYTTRAA